MTSYGNDGWPDVEAVTEKPLHVRVAEALGCKPFYDTSHVLGVGWKCGCPNSDHIDPADEIYDIAEYDTDWSATGPLIEKYGIEVSPFYSHFDKWRAEVHTNGGRFEEAGPTPLIAVCNLILALREAGKLEKAA